MQLFRAFWSDRRAATAIEYGLIIALMSLVIVAGVSAAGSRIEFLFANQDSELRKALNSGE